MFAIVFAKKLPSPCNVSMFWNKKMQQEATKYHLRAQRHLPTPARWKKDRSQRGLVLGETGGTSKHLQAASSRARIEKHQHNPTKLR